MTSPPFWDFWPLPPPCHFRSLFDEPPHLKKFFCQVRSHENIEKENFLEVTSLFDNPLPPCHLESPFGEPPPPCPDYNIFWFLLYMNFSGPRRSFKAVDKHETTLIRERIGPTVRHCIGPIESRNVQHRLNSGFIKKSTSHWLWGQERRGSNI